MTAILAKDEGRGNSATERPLSKQIGYELLRVTARTFGTAFFGLRTFHRERIPEIGAALVCSNHQSFIDPVLVGLAFNRRLNYLARKTLFRFTPFRWLIEYLDAIPVDQHGIGISGIKESLKRLRNGELVLVFPEGARTLDGLMAPLMPGVCVLGRRAEVPLLPVGIDGAFEAWPPTRAYPKLAKLCVVIGEPIQPEDVRNISDGQLLKELERRIQACHQKAKEVSHRGMTPS